LLCATINLSLRGGRCIRLVSSNSRIIISKPVNRMAAIERQHPESEHLLRGSIASEEGADVGLPASPQPDAAAAASLARTACAGTTASPERSTSSHEEDTRSIASDVVPSADGGFLPALEAPTGSAAVVGPPRVTLQNATGASISDEDRARSSTPDSAPTTLQPRARAKSGGQHDSLQVQAPFSGSRDCRAADLLFALFQVEGLALIEDYSCAVLDPIVLHGRMYVTKEAVLFASNIFGRETKKILPFTSMVRIEKRVQAFVIPSLQFTCVPRGGGEEKRVLFTSFFSSYRDDCYALCQRLHREARPELYTADGTAAGAGALAMGERAGTPALDDVPSSGNRPALQSAAAAPLALGSGKSHSDPAASVSVDSGGEQNVAATSTNASSAASIAFPLGPVHALPTRGETPASAAVAAGSPSQSADPAAPAPESSALALKRTPSDSSAASASSASLPGAAARGRAPRRSGTSAPLPAAPPALWEGLKTATVIVDTVLPLSPQQFFEHFIADSAGFSVAEAHRSRGDFAVNGSEWAAFKGGAAGSSGSVSNAGDAASGASSGILGSGDTFYSRTIRLRMPLEPGPFVPKETAVEKVQRMGRYAGHVCVVESSTRSFDIPYADSFLCFDAMVVAPAAAVLPLAGHERAPAADLAAAEKRRREVYSLQEPHGPPSSMISPSAVGHRQHASSGLGADSDEPCLTRIVVCARVDFQKSTMFKSRITSKSEEGIRAFYTLYMRNAAAYVEERVFAPLQDGAGKAPLGAGLGLAAAGGAGSGGGASGAGSVAGEAIEGHRFTGSFLSPTMAAAAANLSLAIPADALMATWLTPEAAAFADQPTLLRNYIQLYAAHQTELKRLRNVNAQSLRDSSLGVSSGAASAAGNGLVGRGAAWLQRARVEARGVISALPLDPATVAIIVAVLAVLVTVWLWWSGSRHRASEHHGVGSGIDVAQLEKRLADTLQVAVQNAISAYQGVNGRGAP